MLNTQINRIACKRIATALGELNTQVVYVGGAVVSLYIDDLAAEDIRPTKDVAIILRLLHFVRNDINCPLLGGARGGFFDKFY